MIDLTPYHTDIAEICQTLTIKRLELVGSVSRDDFCPDSSDIDVLVEFEGNSNLFHRYFALKARLESLFKRKVDVIQAGAVKNPYVQETIERDRVLIYGA
jgi:predicted nucleotidyltransferase